MRFVVRVRLAMSSTRAPLNPCAAKRSVAILRMFSRVRLESRPETARLAGASFGEGPGIPCGAL